MRFSGMVCHLLRGQSVRFWERSGQRSKSRSRKGQKCIFVITCSVSSNSYETNASVHFNSLSSDMTNVALAKVCTLLSVRSS